ncbi:DUF397 domain-containing protein [Thermomonospora sp. CIF 1]|uniref:DUF397 domain-containing protein n=1 Tax=Thermomonospora sp. CIF 1 TaxID=1916083 RepID=UPI000CB1BCE8|nr:DUF397 domain-containing protein [Thermomonospora sp. CIF 1]PKK12364.1 MAG: DUF397 domain-containing protein [Thermomonospora sp. CIF 1]
MSTFDSTAWRKSSHSGGEYGDCVELASAPGVVGVRDSKNPAAGHLQVGKRDFAALLREIKAGHYDL